MEPQISSVVSDYYLPYSNIFRIPQMLGEEKQGCIVIAILCTSRIKKKWGLQKIVRRPKGIEWTRSIGIKSSPRFTLSTPMQ